MIGESSCQTNQRGGMGKHWGVMDVKQNKIQSCKVQTHDKDCLAAHLAQLKISF